MVAGQSSSDEPLCCFVSPGSEHPWGGMTGGDPVEPDPFPLEVDPATTGIPLYEPVADPECQPADLVAPDQLGIRPGSRQLEHDVRDRQVAE